MYHDERLPNIRITVLFSGKEESMCIDIDINSAGEINLNQLIAIIKNAYQLESHSLFFYLDNSYGAFEIINQDQLTKVHFTSLIFQSRLFFTQIASFSNASPAFLINCLLIPPKSMKKYAANEAVKDSLRRLSCRFSNGAIFIEKAVLIRR